MKKLAFALIICFCSSLFVFNSCRKKEDDHVLKLNTSIDNPKSWYLAGTPLSFQESNCTDLSYGYNRAKLTWYKIDPIFQLPNPLLPPNLSLEEISDNYVRRIIETEIRPNKNIPSGPPDEVHTFDLTYYPTKPGPYNFDVVPTNHSSGLSVNGELNAPESRWGGIMRKTPQLSHKANYVNFWLMDPFDKSDSVSGKLFINLGVFCEDILRDENHQNEASISSEVYENDTSLWGIYGKFNVWDINFTSELYQDIGLDGLDNENEVNFYDDYLTQVQEACSQDAYENIKADPAKDDYQYFRGSEHDNNDVGVIERYYDYNSFEGNSLPDEYSTENYPTSSSIYPDREDIDYNGTLNCNETYLEYEINVERNNFVEGVNCLDSVHHLYVPTVCHEYIYVTWYHFKIPVSDFSANYGNQLLNDNFEMIRIYLTGFEQAVTFRFAFFCLSEN